jgi:hypothetical protein
MERISDERRILEGTLQSVDRELLGAKAEIDTLKAELQAARETIKALGWQRITPENSFTISHIHEVGRSHCNGRWYVADGFPARAEDYATNLWTHFRLKNAPADAADGGAE